MDHSDDDFDRKLSRYGGRKRHPMVEIPLLLLAALLAWLGTRQEVPALRIASVLTLLVLWFYLPYYLMKWWLRSQMEFERQQARLSHRAPWYYVNARGWAALYLVLLFGLLWLVIGVAKLLGD